MHLTFAKDSTVEGAALAALTKVVVTSFVDVPEPGVTRHYVEILSPTEGAFHVRASSATAVRSIPVSDSFYLDDRAAKSHLRNFEHLGKGRHNQTVRDTTFHVVPHQCGVTPLSDGWWRCEFTDSPEDGARLGAWLEFDEVTGPVAGSVRKQLEIGFASSGISIDYLYLWLVVPDGYRRGEGGGYEVMPIGRQGVGPEGSGLLSELYIKESHPCFQPWEPVLRDRYVYRPRRRVRLKADHELVMTFQVESEVLKNRAARRAYLAGVIIAVTGGAVTELGGKLLDDQAAPDWLVWALFAAATLTFLVFVRLTLRWTRDD